jgi:hypothetical protein
MHNTVVKFDKYNDDLILNFRIILSLWIGVDMFCTQLSTHIHLLTALDINHLVRYLYFYYFLLYSIDFLA